MQQAVKTVEGGQKHDGRLTLSQVLDWLVADAMVDAEAAEQLKKERRYYRGTMHPLVIVAQQKWKKGSTALTLGVLSEWLAKRVGNLVSENADLATLREQAFKEGMKPLRISGAMKVGAGLTTMDEVLKVAPPVRDPAARA